MNWRELQNHFATHNSTNGPALGKKNDNSNNDTYTLEKNTHNDENNDNQNNDIG